MPDPLIIAELAQGYEGRSSLAMELVAAAAAAGADAAKLQLVYADELATPDYVHYPLFRRLEMPDAVWSDVAALAAERRVALHLDVFGPRSLALAASLKAQAVKIHSTDMGNPGLLRAVAESGIGEVLLSTGGCTAAEIEQALEAFDGRRLVLLHGFQGYPTPVAATQILRLRAFAQRYASRSEVRLGFADHAEPGSVLGFALAAVALGAGASVLEKHLTLARCRKLEDHESALNPDEFAAFANCMRECASALGPAARPERSSALLTDDFGMHESELRYRGATRKHVVAARELAQGSVLSAADIALKRTASQEFLQSTGEVIGRRLRSAVRADEPFRPGMLGDPS